MQSLMMSGPPLASAAHSLPIVSLVVQSSFQKTAAHPPSSSIVSCNFRYIESSDGNVGAAAATVSKKCREEVFGFVRFIHSPLQTGNHLPRAAMAMAIRLLRLRCIPGNFLQIPLQFLFVSPPLINC